MTLMVFFGCALIAFGPSFALFAVTIAKYPVRVILLVVGAFFWLLSLLASAIVWWMVPPLKDQLAFALVFSVIFQEISRYGLYRLLLKAESGFEETLTEAESKSVANHKLSYVIGFGFGLMHCIFSFVNILAQLSGPGVIGLQGHPSNMFIVSAWLSNAVVFNNIFWTVISFKLWKKSKYLLYAMVPAAHLFVSCMTLLDDTIGGFVGKLVCTYAILAISALVAFKAAGGSLNSFCEFMKCCVV